MELNAFTTEQLLEIIDQKLKSVNNLPTVNPAKVLRFDMSKIKEAALSRVLHEKYAEVLDNIDIGCDTLSDLDEMMTIHEIEAEVPEIVERYIRAYEDEIKKAI